MACEVCGCSSGNYFISPFPQFRNYFLGTRYTFRSFSTTLASDPAAYSKDFYQTVEVWGGVNLGTKWQILGFFPYGINRQISDDGLQKTSGLGDITFIGNFNLIRTKNDAGLNHRLWIGAGMKLPTGKYAVDLGAVNASANNQPGTGSTDFIANTMYSLQVNRWSVNASANYKINRSAEGFQFGNRLAISVFGYRSFPKGFATLNPSAGLLYERLGHNKLNDAKVEDTGGYGLLAAGGLDTNFKRVTIGFNVQLPLSQNYAGDQTMTKVRGLVHVTYTF
jgi:hypothetical protein